MWFKKFIIKLTIKILETINAKDFGDFEKQVDELLSKAIDSLQNILNIEK